MKTANRFLAAIAVLAMVVMLFGCSAEAPAPTYMGDENQSLGEPMAEATAAPAAPATEDKSGGVGDGSSLPVIDPGNVANSGKKIIYNVAMAIEAKDAAAAINDITVKVSELGGYVADSQYVEESRNAESTITVRIAPNKLSELTKHISTLGKVLNQNLSSQDVTDQYYDVQSRLTNALAQEAQLLDIMKQAVKIDDILKVRAELNTVQQEIEQMKGQIRLMDNQVGYSTVKISIRQPEPPAVVVEDKPDKGVQFWGFEAVGQKIGRGLSDSFNWTLNAMAAVLMALSYAFVPLLLIALVIVAILIIVRVAGKKKKN